MVYHHESACSNSEKNGYPRWLRLTVVVAFVVLLNLVTDNALFKSLGGRGSSVSGSSGRNGSPQFTPGRVRNGRSTAATTTTTTTSPNYSLWKEQARHALQYSDQFQPDTNSVLQMLQIKSLPELADRGFLQDWKPCTFSNHHSSNNNNNTSNTNKLNMVVLGGSSSSRPANQCSSASHPTGGRYSNLLQDALQQDGFDASVQNMAQGSTTSVWSGLMLDQLIDTTQVDVLIWEHSINDYAEGPETAHTMLEFWLTRVRAVFAKANKPVPPILVVYLWRQDIGLKATQTIIDQGHGHDSFYAATYQASLDVLEDHRRTHGLTIQVVDIAKMIPPQVFVEQRRSLLDDRHHPACMASHLIATVIQYAIYSNLLLVESETCTIDDGSVRATHSSDTTTTAMEAVSSPKSKPQSTLPALLLADTTHIGSFSEWQPRRQAATPTLRVSPESLEQAKHLGYLANIFPAASMPGRDDRKYAFQLPHCSTSSGGSTASLTLVIQEPHLQWLGMVTAGTQISLTINGIRVELKGDGTTVSGLASPVNLPRATMDWVQVGDVSGDSSGRTTTTAPPTPKPTTTIPAASEYKVEMCEITPSNDPNLPPTGGRPRHMWLHQLIGVMA